VRARAIAATCMINTIRMIVLHRTIKTRQPDMLPAVRGDTMKTDNFRAVLHRHMESAEQRESKFVDVNSGKLHREVAGYPGASHRMPVCCE
jgi:hypothetical protein